MRISDSLVIKLLANSKKVSKTQLESLKKHEAADKKALQYLAVKMGLISEEDLTKLYAKEIEIPFIELTSKVIDLECLKLLPKRVADKYKAVVFKVDSDGTYEVAMEDPEDVQSSMYLRKLLGSRIKLFITTDTFMQSALSKIKATKESKTKPITKSEEKLELKPGDINKAINKLIDVGIKEGASDIHIEPRPDVIAVRYRIDGVLSEYHKLPLDMLSGLVDEVKLIGGLNNSEVSFPQSGKFKYEDGDETRTIVVGTMPVLDGEKIVMRIVNEGSEAADFKSLGFWGESLKQINKLAAKPQGLILVSGPRGSGRSTTLFSMLTKLYSPTISMATIEDPIEHRISGVNQTAVNLSSGVTFEVGLRAILDHDPNIILVGELRDRETAELSVQAAHKGHLVLSTIFTPNAASSVKRLRDVGIEPHQIASSLNGVISQRLVRRLCESCAVDVSINRAQLKQLKTEFGLGGSLKTIHKLEKEAVSEGVGSSKAKSLSSSDFTINKLWRASKDGCKACSYTGHRGRIGLFEVLVNDDEITKLIVSKKVAADIEKSAVSGGMIKMKIDGLIKALRGLTSIDDVLRATSAT